MDPGSKRQVGRVSPSFHSFFSAPTLFKYRIKSQISVHFSTFDIPPFVVPAEVGWDTFVSPPPYVIPSEVGYVFETETDSLGNINIADLQLKNFKIARPLQLHRQFKEYYKSALEVIYDDHFSQEVKNEISEDFFLTWFSAFIDEDDDYQLRVFGAIENSIWNYNELAKKLKETRKRTGFQPFSLLAQEKVIYLGDLSRESAAFALEAEDLFEDEDEDDSLEEREEALGGWENIKEMFQIKITHQLDVRIFKRSEGGSGGRGGSGGGGSGGGSGGGGSGGGGGGRRRGGGGSGGSGLPSQGGGGGGGGSGLPSQGGGKSGGAGKRPRPYDQ